MVRESTPELQALVGSEVEKRHGTRIPLDRGNSRILRQSITNYLTQTTSSLQEELTNLQKLVEQVKLFTSSLFTTFPLTDQQMNEMENFIKLISISSNKIKSLLKQIEPKSENGISSSSEKRNSRASIKCTQYNAFALVLYGALTAYKDYLDSYYTKLISNSHQRPLIYWSCQPSQEEDQTQTPLFQTDVIVNALKTKQTLSTLEYDICTREKRIHESHILLNNSYANTNSSSFHHLSSNLEYCDMESSINSPTNHRHVGKKTSDTTQTSRRLSRHRRLLILLITLVLGLIIAAVGITLIFLLKPSDSLEDYLVKKNTSYISIENISKELPQPSIAVWELLSSTQALSLAEKALSTKPSDKNSQEPTLHTIKATELTLAATTTVTMETFNVETTTMSTAILKTIKTTDPGLYMTKQSKPDDGKDIEHSTTSNQPLTSLKETLNTFAELSTSTGLRTSGNLITSTNQTTTEYEQLSTTENIKSTSAEITKHSIASVSEGLSQNTLPHSYLTNVPPTSQIMTASPETETPNGTETSTILPSTMQAMKTDTPNEPIVRNTTESALSASEELITSQHPRVNLTSMLSEDTFILPLAESDSGNGKGNTSQNYHQGDFTNNMTNSNLSPEITQMFESAELNTTDNHALSVTYDGIEHTTTDVTSTKQKLPHLPATTDDLELMESLHNSTLT